MNQREIFLSHLAQTSLAPLAIEVERAEGMYMYKNDGSKLLDLIAGISVSNLGHRHPAILNAIQGQLDKYLHLMVYGELIQTPQISFAKLLSTVLPEKLNTTYFVNSGSEAVEGAMKLAKRFTGRYEIVCFQNSYHGSTQGALSIIGSEEMKRKFRPLLPGIRTLKFNSVKDLQQITSKTACVIIEPIQAEAGVVRATDEFIQKLRKKCDETGTLLVFDEIQTGFGRTGKLFAFEHYQVVPDILLLAKGMAGGMPLGAFISSNQIMKCLAENPVLGHITTFGGHPVSCAAGKATLETLLKEELIAKADQKGKLFVSLLRSEKIRTIKQVGLMLAVEFDSFETNFSIIERCIQEGIFTDWFLFAPNCLRIAPPLIITEEEILMACDVINKATNP